MNSLSILLNLILGIIIVIWFIRLGFQMGLPGKTSKTTSDSGIKQRLYPLFRQQKEYAGETVTRKELFEIFAMAVLFRVLIYLFSLIYMYITSDANTFAASDFITTWKRWDAPNYIEIAQNGYGKWESEGRHLYLVFFPLYPWLLRIVHLFVPNWEVACLVLSSLSYAIGCCFFYATISAEYSKSIAYKSLILLSVFPFSFFFGAMMTESLFFCTISMGFYFIRKHNWLAVGLVGILCALCRIQGVIIMGVAGVEFLITYPFFQMYREKRIKEFFRAVFTKGIFLLLAPIGNLIYLYINYRVEGNPFQFSVYQYENWYHKTTWFTNCLQEILTNLRNPETTNTLIMSIWLPELICFVLAIALLIYGLKRHPLKYTAFLLVYTLINYSVTFLISGGRYMNCAFPIFMIGGEILDRHPKWFPWVVALSTMIMTIYMVGYFQWKQIM